ncbi:MAG: hypothetical protein HY052_06655, partial [Proteobacteria bacterium]|nr:hypothetical protein [Pseudomonadota bacterium]
IPDSKHDIWLERDELRVPWLTKVDAFLTEQINKLATAPKKPAVNKAPKPPKAG